MSRNYQIKFRFGDIKKEMIFALNIVKNKLEINREEKHGSG